MTNESANKMTQSTNSHLHAKTTWKAHLWMVFFSVIIAGSFPVVAAITPGHDSTVLTFWRFLTATVIFGLMLPFVKGVRFPGWKDLGRYSVVGGSYGFFLFSCSSHSKRLLH